MGANESNLFKDYEFSFEESSSDELLREKDDFGTNAMSKKKEVSTVEDVIRVPEVEVSSKIQNIGNIKIRVDEIKFEGVIRTQNTLIKEIIKDLYRVDTLEDLITKSTDVRDKLAAMGCFESIKTIIDMSTGLNSTPGGLEILYVVEESPLLKSHLKAMLDQDTGTFNVATNMNNLLGMCEKIMFTRAITTTHVSDFAISFGKSFPNIDFQPTLNIRLAKETNKKEKYIKSIKTLFDLSLRSNKRIHSFQLEGASNDFLNESESNTGDHPSNEYNSGNIFFAARHIISKDYTTEYHRKNVSKFSTEIAVMEQVAEKSVMMKNVADVQRDIWLHKHLKLRAIGQWGMSNQLPFLQRRTPDERTLMSRSTLFWNMGLDLTISPPLHGMANDEVESFLQNYSVKPHVFINTGGDGVITTENNISSNITSTLKNTELSVGFGLKVRINDLANVGLNYSIPLWSHCGRAVTPRLKFGFSWNF